MNRTLHLLIIVLSLISPLIAKAEGDDSNLDRVGRLYLGSESSENIGLYCVDPGGLNPRMALMTRDKNKILAVIPVPASSYIGPRRGYLDIKWNKSGSMVAIHYRFPKHSKVLIYYKKDDGNFGAVSLPNISNFSENKQFRLKVEDILSSGQEPDIWENNNLLIIKYRFRTKDGTLHSENLRIHIDNNGKFIKK